MLAPRPLVKALARLGAQEDKKQTLNREDPDPHRHVDLRCLLGSSGSQGPMKKLGFDSFGSRIRITAPPASRNWWLSRRADMARGGYDVLRFGNLFRMGVLWTLAVILSYLKLLFQKVCRSPAVVSFPRSSPENAPVTGLACIVTGASSGIGKETAEALTLHGYHVILAGRSMTRLLEVKSELTKKHGSISIEALELDLCSANSIVSFKSAVETSLQSSKPARQLQLLINNAGILACSQRWTDDGFDSMMASNYLGPFLLSQQLLPLLHEAPHARIVNVSSFTHRCVCILLVTYELHRRLSDTTASSTVSVLAADPGIVKTNIMHEMPGWLEWSAHFVLKSVGLLQSPQRGAIAVIDAALAPKGLSGKYFFGGNGKTLKSSFLSYDSDLGRQLWETSSRVYRAYNSRDNY